MAPPLTRRDSPALTREELVNVLTMPLLQANVLLAAGPRIYDAPTAVPLKIPRLTDVSASGWYAEGETISDSEAPTDYLTLLPPTLKSCKTWLPISTEVIRNSPLALEANMRDQLVFSVSRLLEIAFFKGDATPDADGNHTPEGILNWAGTQKVDMAGAVPDLDDFAMMIGRLEASFATPRRWFMSPQMLTHVRTIKDAYGRYQLQPNPVAESGLVLFGIPVSTTVHLNTGAGKSSIVLADTDLIVVGRDQSPEARIFTETLAKSDEIALRVSCRYDIGAVWPQGIAILENALNGAGAPLGMAGPEGEGPEIVGGEPQQAKRTVQRKS